MKKSTLLLTFIALCLFSNAQVHAPSWLDAFGSPPTQGNYEEGEGIAAGSDGNIYVGSRYAGTPVYGMPTYTVSPSGVTGYVTAVSSTKLTPALHGVWSKEADGGSTSDNYGGNMALDQYNNTYVVGVYNSGNGWFCSQTLSSGVAGGRYTNSSYLGTWGVPNGVCVDKSGNAYVCGDYSAGNINIGGTLSYLNGNPYSGYDGFVCQINPGLTTTTWAIPLHGVNCNVQPQGVAVDQSGYLWVCGGYTGTPTFDTITLPASGSTSSLFVAKLESSDGHVLNVYTAQNAGPGVQLCIDLDNNIYVAGNFTGTATWGTITRTSSANPGINCAYAAKLRGSDGQFQWVVTGEAKNNNSTQANGISIDKNWDITIDGKVEGASTFTGVLTDTIITGNASGSAFIARFASGNGSLLFAEAGGGPTPCNGYYVTTDLNRQIYCTGTYGGNSTSPVFGTSTLPSGSSCACNIYVARMDSTATLNITPSPQTTYCAGQSYTLPITALDGYNAGEVFNASNVFTVQLSDATGSFASGGTNIGSLTSSATSGTINISIPAAQPTGSNYLIRVTSSSPSYCSIVKSLPISITNTISLTITPSSPIVCKGSSVTLKASGGTTYQWSPANTADSIVASPLTDTTYSVTAVSGLCTGSTTVAVTVNPVPTVSITGNTTVCAGASSILTGNGGTSYVWSDGSTNNTLNVAPASTGTQYSVTGTTGGCSAKATVTMTVNPLPNMMVTPSNPTICQGGSITMTASGAGATGSYTWKPSTGIATPSAASTNGSPVNTTTYTVVGMNTNGCADSTLITLNVNPKPIPSISSSQAICMGGSASLSASGGTSYTWAPATGLSSTTIANPAAIPLSTTTYTVSVSNGSCTANDSVTITVNPLPTGNAVGNNTILIGESTGLDVTNASTGSTYSWTPASSLSCSTCASPVATPTTTTVYYVTITDNSGCSINDSVQVVIKEVCGPVYIPNAFSPNGDGHNDALKVFGNCIKGMEFIVCDRWGNTVYESTNPNDEWDGTCKGRALNTGTYVYTLVATDADNNIINKKGNITILR